MKFKLLVVGVFFSCLSLKAQSDDPCGATALNIDTVCTLQTGTTVGATSTAGVPGWVVEVIPIKMFGIH
ncbi:MAG: hypothetical protein IPH42_12815 [Bacteroidetes bacterium]|nr:hypothetical protein [Bacteroidota bacterium]